MRNPIPVCTRKGHISANMTICPLDHHENVFRASLKTPCWEFLAFVLSTWICYQLISLLVRALCGFSNSAQIMNLVLTSVSLCASPFLSQQLTSGSWITQWFSCSENTWFITGWINTAFWMGTVVGRFQQIINYTQTSQRDLCAHFNQHCANLFAFSFSAEQTLVSSELCSCCKGQ